MPICFPAPDPHVHRTLQVLRLCLTIASIIMTIIVVLIIRFTPSISGVYSRLLYMLIVTVEIFDIYSQLIFDPQYIMPYLCVYRDSPMLNIPMSPAWGFIIWITLFALNVPIYSTCFIHRHQLIIPPDSMLKMSKHAQIAVIFVIALPCVSYGYAYYISWDTGIGWIKKLLSDDWDKSVANQMECMFQYAELRNVWGASLFLASIVIASSISLHTFALIRKARTLSAKTKSFHRMLLLALIAAAAVPMTFLVAPFASAMAYYLFFEKYFNYSIPVMDIANVLIAFHSLVHSLVLILTTPIFRKRLLNICCPKGPSSPHVLPFSPISFHFSDLRNHQRF